MNIEIKNRWTGDVQFECELSAEIACRRYGARVGFAVRQALGSNADLRDADLSGAILSGAILSGADLRGAVLSGADCPVTIPDIHKAVYEAASKPGALTMESWHHACGTSHCRAGWVVTLAGDVGRALEYAMGTASAAAMIYMASDPKLERVPDFYCSNSEALEDMRRLAEAA